MVNSISPVRVAQSHAFYSSISTSCTGFFSLGSRTVCLSSFLCHQHSLLVPLSACRFLHPNPSFVIWNRASLGYASLSFPFLPYLGSISFGVMQVCYCATLWLSIVEGSSYTLTTSRPLPYRRLLRLVPLPSPSYFPPLSSSLITFPFSELIQTYYSPPHSAQLCKTSSHPSEEGLDSDSLPLFHYATDASADRT
jgi:hypothetical protein